MVPANYVEFANYNRWMNGKILGAASKLKAKERRRDLGAFFGSIHQTLTHILVTDRAWLARLTGEPGQFRFEDAEGNQIAVVSGTQDIFSEFPDLLRARDETDSRILDFANTLTTARLEEHIRYRDTAGVSCDHPTW